MIAIYEITMGFSIAQRYLLAPLCFVAFPNVWIWIWMRVGIMLENMQSPVLVDNIDIKLIPVMLALWSPAYFNVLSKLFSDSIAISGDFTNNTTLSADSLLEASTS